MFKIIKAKKENLEDVFNILQAANRFLIKHGMEHWRGFYRKEKVLENIKDKKCFLMKKDKKFVGTFTLSFEKPALYEKKKVKFFKKPKGDSIYLSALAVLPSEQGKGHGKKAMDFVEKYTKKKEHRSVVFDVLSSYKKLNDFYKKLGYQKIGEIKGKKATGNIYYKKID